MTCITVTQYSIWQVYSSAVGIDELNFQKRRFQTEEFLETKFDLVMHGLVLTVQSCMQEKIHLA